MTAAYFEDHPTDPEKVILRKPSLDQGAGYERGFVDGMQYQMQSSVDKAVNAMSQRTWVGLTPEEFHEACWESYVDPVTGECSTGDREYAVRWTEAKLKEKNT
jgi:hypothetical protein